MPDKNWQFELEEYIKQGEPDKAEKSEAWQTAIGLQAVDGLNTSDYLLDTAKEHIEGKITIDEAQKNSKVGSVDLEVNESTYSPVEEIDKCLDLNTSKVLFKKAGNLDVKAAAAAVKKYLDKKYTFKTSIESQSMIKSMKK